jgi:hypothetical protein
MGSGYPEYLLYPLYLLYLQSFFVLRSSALRLCFNFQGYLANAHGKSGQKRQTRKTGGTQYSCRSFVKELYPQQNANAVKGKSAGWIGGLVDLCILYLRIV